jgi:hypothetical protein
MNASSSSPLISSPMSSLKLPALPFSLRSRTRYIYYTIREAEISVKTESKSEADIITDSGEDTEDLVDSDDSGDYFNAGGKDESL